MNKVVFITGASSGIGEATAYVFAQKGYDVVLCARRADRLNALENKIKKNFTKSKVLVCECDVTKESDLISAKEKTVKEFGRIDVVLANAGFGMAGRIEKMEMADYRRLFETNVFGVLSTIFATIDEIKKTKGVIAIMGSANGHVAEPKKTAYCMSKFAVRGLADALYWEMRPEGVAVTLLSPGIVETEIRNVDKFGKFQKDVKIVAPKFLMMKAEDAAKQVVTAIENREKERVITFHAKAAVWAKRFAPVLLTPLLSKGKSVSRG